MSNAAAKPALPPAARALQAAALGARLPPLLVAAERVANTVAQGVHGRRRVGQGDSFWQYRPFVSGDAPSRIDWRQSARADRVFIRETEWEAAQTVCLWRDGGSAMRWQSKNATTTKLERAEQLLLALSSLLLRGGERVRLIAHGMPAVSGRGGVEALAGQLLTQPPDETGLPPEAQLPRHARAVLIGDMLAPLDQIHAAIGRLASLPITGHVLQVLDPAEIGLPYTGRVRFEGMGEQRHMLVPRVEGVRDAYAARLLEQQNGIAAIAAAAGWGFSVHRTDHPPETALLALYTALSPMLGRRR
jgi:uncharacterized protein (DUF58 family)